MGQVVQCRVRYRPHCATCVQVKRCLHFDTCMAYKYRRTCIIA